MSACSACRPPVHTTALLLELLHWSFCTGCVCCCELLVMASRCLNAGIAVLCVSCLVAFTGRLVLSLSVCVSTVPGTRNFRVAVAVACVEVAVSLSRCLLFLARCKLRKNHCWHVHRHAMVPFTDVLFLTTTGAKRSMTCISRTWESTWMPVYVLVPHMAVLLVNIASLCFFLF